ncbi:MAG: hypothetical protein C3F11_15425 [Methylocystaceae bacterium]|nr:MAG: hypothetical protein C3F11_15425 [Methylocystaceae bacterium]
MAFARSNVGECSFADEVGSTIIWSPTCNPYVLAAEAEPVAPDHPDAFDISYLEHLAAALCYDGGEHILFSDGARHLQLAVIAGSVLEGPVCLRYALSGFRGLEAQTLTLNRLCHLRRRCSFSKSLYVAERRASRYALMLRAWDGAQAGASQREIAMTLFGENAVRRDWDAGFLRTRVQRLIRGAEQLVGGGYRRILR